MIQRNTEMPSTRGVHGARPGTAVFALVSLLCSMLILRAPAANAVTAFTSKFTANVNGDITFAANANTTCPTGCTTGNNAAIVYQDIDGDAATFNSSTADVVAPTGSTVLFAGLFWSGNLAAGSQQGGSGGTVLTAAQQNAKNTVQFKVPGGAYQTITALATDVDTDGNNTATAGVAPVYHAYADVTTILQNVATAQGATTGPNGTYGVANIQAGLGTSGLGHWAGWTLVVAYGNPTEQLRNLNVFNGFNRVATTSVDIPFGPFITPVAGSGPVNAKIGFVAQDGDLTTGDAVTLGSTSTCTATDPTLSDTLNPANNFLNSSITRPDPVTGNPTAVTTRNPNGAVTWGYDADIVKANGVLANGSTNACLRLKTTGDVYYPDVVTTSIDIPQPKVTSTKTGVDLNGGNLNPGDIIEYTISMTNAGNDIATDVVATDAIPASTTYVPGTLSVLTAPATAATGAMTDSIDSDIADFTGGAAHFYLGTTATASVGGRLAPNASTSVKFQVQLNASTPGGTTVTNTAQITYKGATIPSQTVAPVSTAATSPIAPQVDLVVTKTDGATVSTAGAPVTYTIKVKNNGPQPLVGGTVTDTIPSSILTPTWTCSVAGQSTSAACGGASGSGSISTTVNLGSGDTATYTVTGTLDPATPAGTGTLINTASAAVPAGYTELVSGNNSATDTNDVDRKADLGVTKTDGITDAIPGTSLTYTIKVTNNGPSNAGLVSVTDTVPSALTSVTWTCSATASSSCTSASGSGNAIATSATLINGGVATYVVTGTVAPGTPAGTGTLVNSAKATPPSGVTDPTSSNDTATDTDNVTPVANLGITKTDGITDAVPGTTVTYTVKVTNAGPSTATNAVVTDTVPSALTNVTWTCSAAGAGASCAASGIGNAISTTGTVPVGSTLTYTITGTLDPTTASGTGTLVNTAKVDPAAGTSDPTPGNNSATDTDNVKATAELSITKTDGLTNAIPGANVTYTVTVSNAGPSTVTNAAVNDSVPSALSNVVWTCVPSGATAFCGAASGSGNTIATTATLAAGTNVVYTITGLLDAAAPAASASLVNTAAAVLPSGVTDPTPGPTQATDTDNVTPRVDLSITKTDGLTAATPGSTMTYTVVVSNAGPSTATNVAVNDAVPSALTNVTWSCASVAGSTCNTASGTGNTISTTATLGANTLVTYTVTGTLNPSTPGGTQTLANTATVAPGSGAVDTSAGNDSATDTDDVVPVADLSVTKTANVSSALPGATVTYTITVANAGPSSVTGAQVSDAVPSALTNVSWTCAAGAGASCTSGGTGNAISTTANLAAGSSVVYTVTGTIAGTTAAGDLANTATVTAPSGVVDAPGNNSGTATVSVAAQTDLSVTKTDGTANATPGATTTYTIVVTNAGPNAVTGATVSDPLPAGVTGATWTCSASTGSACGAAAGTGALNTTANLLVSGTATYTVTATIAPTATGTVKNIVTVALPAGINEADPLNNTASDEDTLVPSGDLGISKTDGSLTAVPGTTVTYTIIATNGGPSIATNAVITDTVPSALSNVSWTCSATAGSSCAAASGTGSINTTATLAVNGKATYTLVGTIDADATGTLSNSASISLAGFPDANPLNNTATDDDTLKPSGDLSISKNDGITDATPGSTVTYTVTASNAGPSTVVGALINDSLPSVLTNATWSCVATTGSSCVASGSGNITNSAATIKPGGSAAYTIVATVAPGTPNGIGTLVNTATITAPSTFTETAPGNESAQDVDNVSPKVDLGIVKTDNATAAVPGTQVVYTLTVSNSGPSTATNALVTDSLPAALLGATWTCAASGVGASCGAASGSGNLSSTVTLPTGTTATYTITSTLSPTAPAGIGTLKNTAKVAPAAGTVDTNSANDTSTDSDDVTPKGDLSILKTDAILNAVPGSTATYTVTVGNAGPSTVSGASVVDNLPSALLNANWTCAAAGAGAACGSPSGAGSLNTTATIPAGQTVVYTITATVDPTTPAGTGTLINTATVSAPVGFTDATPGNNSATDTDNVTPQANLSITKTDGSADAIAGNAVSYSIVVTNSGPSFAANTAITDTVPASLSGVAWTCASAGGATCSTASGTGNNLATTANIPVGGSVTYTVGGTLAASATGALVNTAKVAPGSGTTNTNPVDTATDTDTIKAVADLAVTKVRTGGIVAGSTTSYTITAKNNGPSNVAGATITDTLPSALTNASWTCSATAGSSCAAASGSGSINTTADIAAGGTVTYILNATIDPNFTGSLVNQASAKTPVGVTDPDNSNDTSKVTDSVGGVTDLAVTKSHTGTLVAGGSTTYNVVVTNNGPSTAFGANLNDPIPTGIASWTWSCNAPGVGASCGAASGTGSINTTYTLPPGQSATYTITAQIDPKFGGSLSQVATVAPNAGSSDPTPGNDSATDIATVSSNVDLQVTKTDSKNAVVAGTSNTYTIAVKNTGPSFANAVVITDTMPANLINATWTCAASFGSSCASSGTGNINTTADIAVGGTVTFTVVGTVSPASPLGAGALVNKATATSPIGVTELTPLDNSATDTDTVTATAALSMTKTDSITTAVAGNTVTYTIVASNAGPSNVLGATVADSLASALNNASWTCAATVGATCPASGTGSINALVDLAVGAKATFTLTATVNSGATGNLTNTASITPPSGVSDPNGPTSATDTDVIGLAADLGITKSDSALTAIPGSPVTYTIVATNAGPSAALNSTVVDTLPADLVGATWTCVGTSGATCAAGGNGSINELVNLPVGGVATFTINATVAPGSTGILKNTASITPPANVGDNNSLNNTASDSDTLTPQVDLSLVKSSAATTAVPGTSTTYTIVVKNSGPSAVSNATVTDILPSALTNSSWTCTAISGSCGTSGTGSINDLVSLAANGSATYTLTALIDPAATGSLTNTASVTAPIGVTDLTPGNNTSGDTDQLTPKVDVRLTKTDNSLTAIPGAPITYSIVATNAGPSAAPGVSVVDALPAALSGATWSCVASAGSSCGAVSGTGNINTTADLGVNGKATYTLTANVDSAVTGTLINSADVSVPNTMTDLSSLDNNGTDINTLVPTADLKVTKVADSPLGVVAGDVVTYTITVSNNGPSRAVGPLVSDTLPAALTAGVWTCAATAGSSCGAASGTGNISSVSVSLEPKGTATFTFAATLSPSANGTVSNTASVAYPPNLVDPTPGPTDVIVTTPIVKKAHLTITKTDGATSASAADPITYTIVVNNDGPSSVSGAQVIDTLPAELINATWTCVGSAAPLGTCGAASGTGSLNTTVDLEPKASATYVLKATVDPLSRPGTLVNTAKIVPPVGILDTDPSKQTATDTNTLIAVADLAVTKTDGLTTAVAGSASTYTITVKNNGPAAVYRATVVDTIAGKLDAATWTCAVSPSVAPNLCAQISGADDIDTTLDLAPGAVATFTVKGTINPALRGVLLNTATAGVPAGVTDPTATNNSATDSTNLTAKSDVSITKTNGTDESAPGDTVTYTIKIDNAGPSSATDVHVVDALLAPFTSATWTCAASAGVVCAHTTGTGGLDEIISTMGPKSSLVYTYKAKINSAARNTLTNEASVTAVEPDPNQNSNKAVDVDTLVPKADIRVVKKTSATLIPGMQANYIITVSNAGPSDAAGVAVVDNLPAGLQNAAWTCAADNAAVCSAASGTGNIATSVDLPAGTKAVFSLNADIDPYATGGLGNTATATAPDGIKDPQTDNNSSTATSRLIPTGNVRVTKTDNAETQTPGEEVTYVIEVTNDGPSAAPDAFVVEDFPAVLSDFKATCTPDVSSVCSVNDPKHMLAQLGPKGKVVFMIKAMIDPAATGTLTNTATVNPGVVDGPEDNVAVDNSKLVPKADLAITKDDNTESAVPGKPLTYTIKVTNAGPSSSGPVKISDQLPKGLIKATWTCASEGKCAVPSGSGNIDTTVSLGRKQSATFTLTALVDPDLEDETLANTVKAVLADDVVDPTPGPTEATDTDKVTPETDVSITKIHTDKQVLAGGIVHYTITVKNAGPSSARKVVVADELPSALSKATWKCSAIGKATCPTSSTGSGSIASEVNVAPGASVSFALTATVDPDADDMLENTATATPAANANDRSADDNSATDSVKLKRAGDVSVTKTDGRTYAVQGRRNTYTIVVSNAGPSGLKNIRINDKAPKSLLFASWTCVPTSGKAVCQTSEGSGDIDNVLVDLGPKASVTFTMTGKVDPHVMAAIVNTVTADVPDDGDINLSNNKATDIDAAWKEWLKNPPRDSFPKQVKAKAANTNVPDADVASADDSLDLGALALTGTEIMGLLTIAGFALFGGGALLLGTRRRRSLDGSDGN